jgi:hypothetical protein
LDPKCIWSLQRFVSGATDKKPLNGVAIQYRCNDNIPERITTRLEEIYKNEQIQKGLIPQRDFAMEMSENFGCPARYGTVENAIEVSKLAFFPAVIMGRAFSAFMIHEDQTLEDITKYGALFTTMDNLTEFATSITQLEDYTYSIDRVEGESAADGEATVVSNATQSKAVAYYRSGQDLGTIKDLTPGASYRVTEIDNPFQYIPALEDVASFFGGSQVLSANAQGELALGFRGNTSPAFVVLERE